MDNFDLRKFLAENRAPDDRPPENLELDGDYDKGGKYYSEDGAEAFRIQPFKMNDIEYTKHEANRMGRYIVGLRGEELKKFISDYMGAWEADKGDTEAGRAFKEAMGKGVNEALTVSGNSEEEIKKNAEELLALAKKVGLDKAEIKYSDNGNVYGVELNDKVEDRNAGKTRKVSDLQDKQYQAAKAVQPKDDKPSFKAKKLKKLTVGGKTYEKGESDPNDDGRIESIEKYPNGYFISGGVYSDYGDGDGPKEGYGYAIDLKGNEMDEADLEGMYEGKNVNEYSDYEPGTIAPADLYFSDKHGKLVAMDDVDDKYHDSLEGWLVVKKGDKVPHPED